MPLPLLGLLGLAAGGTAAAGTAIGAARRAGKPRNPLEDDPDALTIDDGEDSAFLSFLDTLGTPGRAVNNVLLGNVEGAGRNLVDFGGDVIDSVLPGDWIPHISRKMDKPGFSDVVGGMDPGIGKFAVDVLGGVATDPISFIPGSMVAKGLGKAGALANQGIKAVDKAVPGVEQTVQSAGNLLKRTTGHVKVPDWAKGMLDKARKVSGQSGTAQPAALGTALEGLSEQEGRKLFGAIQNVTREGGLQNAGGKAAPLIADEGVSAPYRATQEVLARTEGQFPLTPGASPVDEMMVLRGNRVKEEVDPLSQMMGRPAGSSDELLEAMADPGFASPFPLTDVDPRLTSGIGVANNLVTNPVSKQIEGEAAKAFREAPFRAGERIVAGDRGNIGTIVSVFDDVARVRFLNKTTGLEKTVSIPVQGLRKYSGDVPMDVVPDIPKTAKGLETHGPFGAIDEAPIGSMAPDPAAVQSANKAISPAIRFGVPAVDEMLGAIPRAGVSRSGAEMANVTDAVNMAQGGVAPELAKVGVDDLPDLLGPWKSHEQQVSDIVRGLEAQGVQGAELAKLSQAAQRWVDYSATQFREAVKSGAFEVPQGRDLLRESPQYAMRMFTGPESELDRVAGAGSASSSKARSLKSGESVADYLNANPDTVLESNLALAGAKRGSQQASMLAKTSLAKDLVAKYGTQAEEKLAKAQGAVDQWQYLPEAERMAKAGLTEAEQLAYKARWAPLHLAGDEASDLNKGARAIIKEIEMGNKAAGIAPDRETARVLMTAYEGLPERDWLTSGLAKVNKLFKPFATAGAFVPRINFSIRNITTGAGGQILSSPQARGQFPQFAKQMAKMVYRSIDDGLEQLTGSRILRSENEFAQYNQALAAGKGDIAATAALIKNPRIREMYEQGVITDGFAQSELLANEITRTGWSKKWRDIRDWPAKIAKGSEQRARATLYDGLRNGGKSADEAAEIVRDTMFPYEISSVENRLARDAIPFFQWSARAVPQAAKVLAEFPWLAGGASRALTGEDEPLYPYLEGGLNIPVGSDESGNNQYLTSLGLPLESLNKVPASFRDVKRNIIGASSPPLKTLFGALSGEDAYFETPFGSYSKLPGNIEAGALGRAYNVAAGTGLIQPLATAAQTVGKFADDRLSPMDKVLSLLTGAKVQSVDPDLALQQQLTQSLQQNPNIRQFRSFSANQPDDATDELLRRYQAAKKQLRAKRAASSSEE